MAVPRGTVAYPALRQIRSRFDPGVKSDGDDEHIDCLLDRRALDDHLRQIVQPGPFAHPRLP